MDSAGRSGRGARRRSSTPLWAQLLTSAVEARAEAVAVRYAPAGDISSMREVSYRDVDEASSRLARELINHRIGPGDTVAIAIGRSLESVVAVWAVAKTGAAFVPVDPGYPPERIAHLTSDSGAVLGLTVAACRGVLSDELAWLVLDDTGVRQRVGRQPEHPVSYADRVRVLTAQHPAYVIYTSGSTGVPKGVVVTHAGLGTLAATLRERYGIAPDSRVTHLSSPSFDFAVMELLLTFSAGATLVVAPPGVFGGEQLGELLRAEAVTHLMITPGALESVDAANLPDLGVVIVGGEAVNPELTGRWTGDGRRFFNAYGPTEATVVTTATEALAAGELPPLGAPLPGIRIFVLDTRLRPVAPGVVGELYVCGAALAQGYRGQPAVTAARFVANPFPTDVAGDRLYRTGDLVRRKEPDGVLEYVGRSDFQVKVRGFRIELGEIDAALTGHPDVAFAVTVGRELPSGNTALVSYIVPRGEASVDTARLTDSLSVTLPAYMIPAAIVVLDEVPLTPVGKLDRARLPAPLLSAGAYRTPVTPTERLVAAVFAEILLSRSEGESDRAKGRRVGADDDFFALGGDSLLAATAVARIGAALQVRVPVQLLFESPTVAGLAARVDEETTAGDTHVRVMPRPERIPLSYAQQRMWFLNRFDPASAVDHIPVAVRLTGALDIAAMQAAVGDLVARHEVLRTIYPEFEGTGYQVVHPVADEQAVPELVVVDASEAELLAVISEIVCAGFDVTVAAPVRLRLVRLRLDEFVLVAVVHHIAADGFSMAPLTRDVMTAYQARAAGGPPNWDPLPVQYADYALWQREALGGDDDPKSLLSQQIAYWRHQLADLPAQLDLPTDRPRPPVASHRGGVEEFTVDAQAHAGLVRLAHEHHATLFVVVHAALVVLLARLTGARDVVVGAPVTGRGDAVLDELIGMFVNTLVLRSDVHPGVSFAELLQGVRRTDFEAFSHADVPFERLVQVLDPVRSAGRHPLFQVMLTVENVAVERLELPGLVVSGAPNGAPLAKFDVHVTLAEQMDARGRLGGIAGSLGYAADLFDAVTVRGFAAALGRILAVVAADASVVVGDIPLLAADERERLLRAGNATDHSLADTATLASLFAAQVARGGTAPAVTFKDAPPAADTSEIPLETLSYGDFAARVNQLARHLIALGVGPESRVALRMPRSLELLVGVYAVITAGGAYVPLDPDQPAARTDYVVQTSGPCLVLTTSDQPIDTELLAAADHGGALIALDRVDVSRYSPLPVTDADRLLPLRPATTAYVIFTSGSTGRPKGVAVSHAAIVNRLLWMQHQYCLGADDVVLQKTPVVFDVSVWELFWPLQVGARLVIARPDGHRDPAYLATAIVENQVTVVHFVPSMLAVFVAEHSRAKLALRPLRHVFSSGEALPAGAAQRMRELTGARVHNLYGPTEAAVDATYHEVDDSDTTTVPIGAPVWNTRVYVLDHRLHPVAAGVSGELYIAGVQLARGYVGRGGLSAQHFVADPFGEPGQRLYRTGDIVCWRAHRDRSWELEYVGRNDFQVKLRGQRIELREIEAVLAAQAGVSGAVVVLSSTHSGDRLVGYVVADSDTPVNPEEIRTRAREFLASAMVPDIVVVLDAFPLTATGKLDRRALPAPHLVSTTAFRAPATPVEQAVADAFAAVLQAPAVGVDDDFFALGGDSLSAVRMIARVNEAVGTQAGVREVFATPTVAALAARLAPGSGAQRPRLEARARPDDAPIPLSLAQRRMWFLNQFDTASPGNNIPFAVRLTGALDVDALRAAVADVVARHEVLRTEYPAVDGVGYQLVLPPSAVPDVPVVDVTESDVVGWVSRFALRGFDVSTAVPLRIAVLRTATDRHIVVAVVHHIAADGASVAPLVRDLMTAYLARAAGGAPAWQPLPVQYADYTLWQRALLGEEDDPESLAAKQIQFWRATLADAPERLDVPADRPRPQTPSGVGAVYSFAIPAATHRGIVELARAHHASEFMVVHAAFAVLLARLSGSADVTIGVPIAGRGERALDDLVGMFVNTLVLRTVLQSGESFGNLLDCQRDRDLAAFSHAELPFERLVEVLDPVRAPAHHPLFQAALFFQNVDPARLELPGLVAEAVEFDGAIAKFDLQLTVSPLVGEVDQPAAFTYAVDLFDESTVAAMAQRLLRLLAMVVSNPAAAVGDVDLLSAAERTALLQDRNQTGHEVASGLLLDGYRHAVATAADAVALIGPDGVSVTYGEFDARVNQLARHLIRIGVGPESLVGIAMRRSVDLVVAMYATLTAGGAYLPLDPDHPAERLGYVLQVARPVCVLTTAAETIAVPDSIEVVAIDTVALGGYQGDPVSDAERLATVHPLHPAYVIFTSGSTGRPKGVAVSHSAIGNQVAWMLSHYQLRASDRYLQKTAVTFDVSLWGYFLPLQVGATVVLATADGHRDPRYLAETIAAHQVTVTDFVPSLVTVFAAHAGHQALASLRHVFVIGEALAPHMVSALRPNSSAAVHNLYGPTEAAVSLTYREVATADLAGATVPIGVPQWNSQVYVLDGRLGPVPDGVVGELYVTGAQLARGYVRRCDLTSERFVANPFGGPGTRMYRTGDLVRWRPSPSGQPVLDYQGRSDFQVKFRGQRIELGEVEAALLAAPAVSQAVAAVAAAPTGDQLVGYVVAAPGQHLDPVALREDVGAVLPAYMVPAVVVELAAVPLNTSGKLDRKALPAPHFAPRAFAAPVTLVEEVVAGVFADLLAVPRVGRDDNFFALGGNSLSATRLAARLGSALDTTVPVRLVFEADTVANLAARVEAAEPGRGRPPLTAVARPERIPLSPAQQRMWFLNQFDTASAANNLAFAVRMTGELDVAALRAAVGDVVARHEVLRTIYPAEDGVGYQAILPPSAAPELRVTRQDEADIHGWVRRFALDGFDVATDVPLRVALVELGPQVHVVVAVVHHIAADGASLAPLVRDLMTAYLAQTSGSAPTWTPLPVQYADFALWQRQLLGAETDPHSVAAQEMQFWRSALADLPQRLDLPADRPRPATASGRGRNLLFEIPSATRAGLVQLAREQHVSEFVVVHAGFAALLARLSGTTDIAIGSPVAGRGRPELDDLIGMFVNTLVLRTRVDPGQSFAALVADVKASDIAAFSHAELPFEQLVQALDPVRAPSHHPLFQVALFFQNLTRTSLELPGIRVAELGIDANLARFDLQLTISPPEDETQDAAAVFTYAADLYEESTVAGFAARFVRVLQAVVADPHRAVGEVDLLAPDERAALLWEVNQTAFTLAPHPVVQGYQRAVAAHPEAVAVVGPDGFAVTYRDFDARVNTLARHLIQQGVGPESLVGIAMRRSVDLVVGMYAVLATGAGYVPLDPDHPTSRLAYVLEVAQPVCVLTSGDTLAVPAGVAVVDLGTTDLSAYSQHPVLEAQRIAPAHRDHIAYVMFTSGSTGKPKGVAISLAALGNHIQWMLSQYRIGAGDVYLQKTATTFDVSAWGYFLPLQVGATLVLATPEGHRDPQYLAQTIAAQQVTVTDFVPSLLAVFAAHADRESLASLRDVFVIGEALPPQTVAAFQAVCNARVHNVYGPTEATVSVTAGEVTATGAGTVPLGVAQGNVQVYVVDSRLGLVPCGVVGELYVAGAPLARGYWGRPDLTADRFVANPYGRRGARMYRTGDMVRWTRSAAGQLVLDYVGRSDFQVKFRGQRIELGEIEAALRAAPEVSQAVAVVAAGPAGEHLVGYVVAASGCAVDPVRLRDQVGAVVPPYMVPSVVMVLAALPLNTSGKLDRKALPQPQFQTKAFTAAQTLVEEIVAGVFAEVLEISQVGRDDDFFALGGNSLSATRVAARLGAALNIQVPVRVVFEAATVAGLAARVEAGEPASGVPALTATARPQQIPLSLAQQRMWFLNRFDTTSAAYNIPAVVRLTGALDLTALQQALADVVARHEILRTSYPLAGEQPVQTIHPVADAVPALQPVPVTAAELSERIAAVVTAGFDVAAEIPWRVAAFQVADAHDYVVVFVVHHIAGDGWSMGVLAHDVMAAYTARSQQREPGWAPLPVHYADYSLWQREMLGDETDAHALAAQQIEFWQHELAGLPEESTLPADRARRGAPTHRGATVDFTMDAAAYARLTAVARRTHSTVFMVMHTALAVLLSRMSGSDDIAIGTPVAGRGRAEIDNVIGMFVNTLVLRTVVDPGSSFEELLRRQRETDVAAFAHADIPFERVVDVLAPARSTVRSPLFQVMLALQNLPSASFDVPGLRVEAVDVDAAVEKFDISVTLFTAGGATLVGRLSYAQDLYDERTVRDFAGRYERVLQTIASSPDVVVGDIDLLTAAERSAVLTEWVSGGADTGAVTTLPELFDTVALAHADHTAVVCGADRLSYAELSQRAHSVARALIDAGAGPETLVAVALPRSVDLVVALLAVLRAGAGYVPVDPAYPAERIAHMLTDSRPVCALTTSETDIDLSGVGTVLALDRLDISSAAPITPTDRLAPLTPDCIAYVIYTSGSTGRPKGVAVPHRTVGKMLANTQAWFGFDDTDVWTLFHSYAFDFSVWEMWGALLHGSTLVVVDYQTSRSPREFLELLRRQQVTVLSQTPSAFYQLDAADQAADTEAAPLALRYIVFGGEALELRRLASWYARHDERAPRLVNMYGITETTVHVTYRALDAAAAAGEGSLIGRAIPGLRTYLLDNRLAPVPVGALGEIYIAGTQVVRGYVGQPALTAGRFVANPFGEPGSRLYRSGDVARWNAAGTLEYVGRSDNQVKIRGFRIELGEIEAAVLAAPGIDQAAVVVRTDDARDARIVAYVVPADPARHPAAGTVDNRWRAGVAQLLPDYMVPAAFVVVDAIPLTANGKLDRRALPAPVFAAAAARAPRSRAETAVATAYSEVLGVPEVGLDDDFFALGGNSLSATRVAARLGAALDTEVPVRLVFEASTVQRLAAQVHTRTTAAHPVLSARRDATEGIAPEHIPLSPAQQRMWFLNQFDTTSAAYNIPVVVRLIGRLDLLALRRAVGDVVSRHEILRTYYPQRDDGPVQVVEPISHAAPQLLPIPVAEGELTGRIVDVIATGFDVTVEVPLRVVLYRVGEAHDYVVVFVVHHIAGDGWSMQPLARDVMSAYAARSAHHEPGWAPLPVQYGDYALWQHDLLGDEADPQSRAAQQIDYWRAALADLPEESTLPADRPRPSTPSYRGASIDFTVDAGVHRGLAELARQTNTTLFMVVHTALAVVLCRVSGSADVAIGTPTAGRGRSELDDLIGMFVNTLVLRSSIRPGESFAHLLARQRETDLAAFAHADVPFERVVDVLAPQRSTVRSPLFQVMLAFQNLPPGSLQLPGLRVENVDIDAAIERFDVSLTMFDAGDGTALTGRISYAQDLYDEDTIRTFAWRYHQVLQTVASTPQVSVADIDLLTASERSRVLTEWVSAGPDSGAVATVPELFEAVALEHADHTAVVCGAHRLSYAQLSQRANQLARRLIDAGAGPETLVAVALPRSIDLVVALLAVVRCGAGYVPIDPTYPADRIAYLLADAQPVGVVTVSEVPIDFSGVGSVLELDRLDTAAVSAAPIAPAERNAPLTPDGIAYVIYTSGSTGRPKGVAVPHRNVTRLMANTQGWFGFDATDVWTMFHSYAFDFSVWEVWGALLHGATLVVVDYHTSRSPQQFLELLHREKVTVLNQTPSAFFPLDAAEQAYSGQLPLALRWVIFGGEALPLSRLADWFARHGDTTPRLINMYGITETTVHVTYRALNADMARTDSSVIGRALPGLHTYVLDNRLAPVPVGTPGEIYIAGSQVARGYLGQPTLTAGRFVADPFGQPGSRLYRSGDLARWTRDGDLHYLGRADDQVEIHGFRIELGEVAAAVLAQTDIVDAAVIVRTDHGDEPRLVAYVVPAGGGVGPAAGNVDNRWRAGVCELLPQYMVPAAFVVVDAIPLTGNGKLDRRALPAPELRTTAARAPRNAVESRLAELFAQVLGVTEVGVDDSFFAVGGDSIMSIQLVSRARAAGIVLTPRDVFEHRTVAGLAAVAAAAGSSAPVTLPELPGGGVGEIPLTPVLAAHLAAGVHSRFAQTMVLALPPQIDESGLVATLGAVVDHHDALRTRLRQVEARWVFEALPVGAVDARTLITAVDVPVGAAAAEVNAIARAAMDSAMAALDPTAGRMLALTWLRRRDGRDAVTVAAHHYVIDGVSWRILIPDLAIAWAQYAAGAPVDLPAVGTSLRRWAHALGEAAATESRVAEVDYWRAVDAAPDPLLGARALDPAVDTQETVRQVDIRIPVDVTEAVLTRLPQRYRGGVNDGLLAALAVAVRVWRSRRGVDAPVTRLQVEGHGREEPVVPGADLTRTVGWFTSIYPVALDLTGIASAAVLSGGAAAGDLVKSVKEQLLAIPDHGIGYGLLRYANAQTAAAVSADVGQVRFNYFGRIAAGSAPAGLADAGWFPTGEFGAVAAAQDPAMPAAAVVDVNAIVNDGPEGPLLDATFGYVSGILGADEVQELAGDWVAALTALAMHAHDPDAGGLTPSDVPLVTVSQPELDSWGSIYAGLSEVLPLSPLQQGLLFLTQLQADSDTDDYVMQFALELSGDVDVNRLHRCAQAVVDRHANLRAAFVATSAGIPVQVVSEVVVPWRVVTGLADADLAQVMAADRYRFDPAMAPLVRFTVYCTQSGATHFALTTHHILLDGWSMPLLMRDLLILYAAQGDSTVLPPVRPYRDYLVWLARQDHENALAGWVQALAGLQPCRLAPTLAAPDSPGSGMGTLTFELPVELTEELAAVAAAVGVTVNTVVQVAWGAVLASHTDRDDVAFGAAVSGRPPQVDGIDDMIGLFVNTIPVRVRFGARESVRDVVRRMQSEQAALLDAHHVGVAEIQGALGVEGLFDTLLAFESYPVDTEGLRRATTSIDGMQVTGLQVVNYTHYPVTVLVNLDTQLRVKVLYRHDTVAATAAVAVADRLRLLIGEFVAGPDRGLAAVDLLRASERRTLLARNDTAVPQLLDEATLVSLFHAQCERTPDAPAVTFGDTTLSYAELRSRAMALAGALRARGAGPETRVAVAMRRSLQLVVAVYAVLEAGAAYVAVDPDHPTERNDQVLAASAPLCVVTTAVDGFATAAGVPVLDSADLESGYEKHSAPPHPDNLAYVIYTSGSTGRPKGVMITHRQMVNQFRWAQTHYPHGVGDTVLHKTPMTFDISMWELLWPLQTGARVVIAQPDGHRDPQYLAEVIARESVSTVHFVPSMLAAFLELGPQPASPLRWVFAAGEALSASTVSAFAAELPAELHNWYGPAEATVVTAASVTAAQAVPIGYPVANTRVYVLDRLLRQVPPGAAGELYVAGVQLARGYLDAAALTAERFVANPFQPGQRLVRTGDIVRLGEGGLEYLGRTDFQVKLRGQRIELGEVETVLREANAVAQAAAAVVADPDRLIGYVVPAEGEPVEAADVLAHARRRLPAYMVPAVVVALAQLPLNASGKLDRRALPVPEFTAAAYRAPADGLQQLVAAAYAEVLSVEQVGRDDDFFALGGTSLHAGQVVHTLRRLTGAEIRVQWFFLAPTVAGLAARIAESLESGLDYDPKTDASLGVILPIRASGNRIPLFCFHPMAGMSWCYAGLAQYTDTQQPIYGVQAVALSEDCEPPESLPDMAVRYVDEILAVHPKGPYRLLGWSLGGMLAHEVAVQLQALGHQVDVLVMLDSDPRFDLTTFQQATLETLTELGIHGVDAGGLEQLSEDDFVLLHKAIPDDLVVLTPDRLRRVYLSAMRSVELTREFHPRVFDGTVHYFRAAADTNRPDDVHRGWLPYAAQVVDHPVPTRHELMTQPEALAVIGPVLRDLLQSGGAPG